MLCVKEEGGAPDLSPVLHRIRDQMRENSKLIPQERTGISSDDKGRLLEQCPEEHRAQSSSQEEGQVFNDTGLKGY